MNCLFKPFTHFLLSGCLFSHWFVSSPLEIKGIGPFQLHMPLPFAERTNLCAQTLPRLPRPSRCVPRTAGARQVRRCRGAERVTLAEMRRTSDSTLFRLGRGQNRSQTVPRCPMEARADRGAAWATVCVRRFPRFGREEVTTAGAVHRAPTGGELRAKGSTYVIGFTPYNNPGRQVPLLLALRKSPKRLNNLFTVTRHKAAELKLIPANGCIAPAF